MAQIQHYLPQTYLKQWCTNGQLFEHRRVGEPPKLVVKRKSPKGIGCELWSCPDSVDGLFTLLVA